MTDKEFDDLYESYQYPMQEISAEELGGYFVLILSMFLFAMVVLL